MLECCSHYTYSVCFMTLEPWHHSAELGTYRNVQHFMYYRRVLCYCAFLLLSLFLCCFSMLHCVTWCCHELCYGNSFLVICLQCRKRLHTCWVDVNTNNNLFIFGGSFWELRYKHDSISFGGTFLSRKCRNSYTVSGDVWATNDEA